MDLDTYMYIVSYQRSFLRSDKNVVPRNLHALYALAYFDMSYGFLGVEIDHGDRAVEGAGKHDVDVIHSHEANRGNRLGGYVESVRHICIMHVEAEQRSFVRCG